MRRIYAGKRATGLTRRILIPQYGGLKPSTSANLSMAIQGFLSSEISEKTEQREM